MNSLGRVAGSPPVSSYTSPATRKAKSEEHKTDTLSKWKGRKRNETRTIRMGPDDRLRINTNDVFRATRPDEGPSPIIPLHKIINLRLQPLRTDQLPLRILRMECMAIRHNDLHEPIRQVDVKRVPLDAGVGPVCEDGLDEEHVGDSVADGLVDELREGLQVVERGGLGGGGRFVGGKFCLGLGGEEDSAVTIGFEIDANGIMFGGMVEVFDTSRNASDGYALSGRKISISANLCDPRFVQ